VLTCLATTCWRGGELSADYAYGECCRQCAGECDQHGDGAGGGDINTANNSASDVTIINAAAVADLTITKTHSGNFTQGQIGATYTITVTNSGAAATTGR
jgi:hypothetical protein